MRLHETRLINRPLDEVFAYTADFANIEEWDPGVAESRKNDDAPPRPGAEYELTAVFGGRRIPMTYEVTVWEPDSRVVLEGRGEGIHAVDEIRFEATGEGTLVDYTADLTFTNWVRWVAPLMKPMMKRVGARALDGLVAALHT